MVAWAKPEPGFFVEHFIKDLSIALEEANALNLDLPSVTLAKQLYTKLVAKGYGRKGTQVVYKNYIP